MDCTEWDWLCLMLCLESTLHREATRGIVYKELHRTVTPSFLLCLICGPHSDGDWLCSWWCFNLFWFKSLSLSLSLRLDPLTLHCVLSLRTESTLYWTWNEMRREFVTCFECIVAPTVWMFDCSASANSWLDPLHYGSRSDFCERRAMVMVNGMLFTPYRFCVELLPLSVCGVERERESVDALQMSMCPLVLRCAVTECVGLLCLCYIIRSIPFFKTLTVFMSPNWM